ncbi:glycosyltransferase [Caulobacter sp. S45]|uniref:glycosyltransferase n=1 Tax=Caulobacter sp. S45 TaxID=1641861 RepID=UPI00131DAF2A|nr:glycosyltransferase [Caulobacter sp. S45]
MNFAILLCNTLVELSIRDELVEVSLCVPLGYNLDAIIGLNKAVNVIAFEHVPWNPTEFRFSTFVGSIEPNLEDCGGMTYPKAVNGAMDIVIADVWILLTGIFGHGPIMPLKPYLVYAPDFIQRVVPEIYSSNPVDSHWLMNGWQSITMQNSRGVLVTSVQTGRDAVSYAGVPSSKVHLLPMANAPLFSVDSGDLDRSRAKTEKLKRFFSGKISTSSIPYKVTESGMDQSPSSPLLQLLESKRPYFLWVTNTTRHKNQERAVEALERYYEEFDGRLACIMCGPTTELYLQPCGLPWVDKIHHKIKKSPALIENLILAGTLSTERYKSLLSDAAFLWHNVLYDNGTFSVIEAARLGTRSLVSVYPQMMEIVDHFRINAETFDPWDVEGAAIALKGMEKKLIEQGAAATCNFDDDDAVVFKSKLSMLLEHSLTEVA